MKQVLVIVGPTASGKTALGIQLAKHYDTDIINGDSVQVYQGYDVGSAKVTESEKQGIMHHLLDHVSPSNHYDVKRFQIEARSIIEQIQFPIIVGGTGFYIKAALYDYDFSPEERKFNDIELENEVMYKKIIEFDPEYSGDPNNRRRLLRAFELVQQGHLPSSKKGKNDALYDVLTIYLDIDRTILKKRLSQRLEKQIAQGFIEEVQTLQKEYTIKDVIGYREISLYLDGIYDYDTMNAMIIKKTMAFAKKQKTWFKHQMHVHAFDATSETLVRDVIKVVDAWKK